MSYCYKCGNHCDYKSEASLCSCCGTVIIKAALPWHISPGTLIKDRYVIGPTIGYGGFGVTYCAYDLVLEQKTAIKEYLPSELATRMPEELAVTVYEGDKANQYQYGLDGFIEEARKLAQFSAYPGIVKVLDFFKCHNTAYLVMDFIDGKTIKAYLEEQPNSRLDFDEALKLILPIMDALEEVHKTGMIHRDISPDNILMTKDGHVVLIDFGAARYATTGATKSLSVILKPGYAPEEQYRSNGNQGAFSDVYAVGATLYRMITGIKPEESLERGIEDLIERPKALGIDIPENAEIALMNALAVKHYNRYQTINAFKMCLTGNQVAKPIDRSQEIARKYRFKRNIKVIGFICCLLFFLGAGILASRFLKVSEPIVSMAMDSNKSYIPDVIGFTESFGEEVLEEENLDFLIIGKENSTKVPLNKIMRQFPASGQLVDKNTTVEVVISAGRDTTLATAQEGYMIVPDVQYLSEEEGLQLLDSVGFKNVEITYCISDAVVEGLIISQNLTAYEELPDIILGQGIVIEVSIGPENDTEVLFQDIELEKAIRAQIGNEANPITVSDCKQIQELNVTSTQLRYIDNIKYLTNLRVLSLSGDIFDISELSHLKKLNALSFRSTYMDQIDVIANHPNLEKLSIEFEYLKEVDKLSELIYLKELSLIYVGDTVDFGPKLNIDSIGELSSLEKLVVEDISAESLVLNSKQLRSLKIVNCSIENLVGLNQLSELEHLTVTGATPVSVDDLKELSSLLALCLEWTPYNKETFTSIDDVEFLKELPYLETLHLQSVVISDWEGLTYCTRLKELNLAYSNIESLSSILHLEELEVLNISETALVDIDSIERFMNLKNLNISGLELKDYTPLEALTGLIELNIKNETLTSLEVVKQMSQLKALTFNLEKVTDLSTLKSLKEVETLDVWPHAFQSVEPLVNMTKLKVLYINYENARDLEDLSHFNQLEELSINKGEMDDLSMLTHMSQLKTLSLTNCYVKDVTLINRFQNLESFLYMDMDFNFNESTYELEQKIITVTGIDQLGTLPHLDSVFISGAYFEGIEGIFESDSLRILDISYSHLNSVEGLEELNKLQELTIFSDIEYEKVVGNEIEYHWITESLPIKGIELVFHLETLKSLDLYDIELTSLEGLDNLKYLNQLTLSGSNITDIEPIGQLIRLRSLDISKNNVTDLSVLKALKYLERFEYDYDGSYDHMVDYDFDDFEYLE